MRNKNIDYMISVTKYTLTHLLITKATDKEIGIADKNPLVSPIFASDKNFLW